MCRFLEPDAKDLCADDSSPIYSKWRERHRYLTEAIGRVLEDYSLVKFAPLNIRDEESLSNILFVVDNCIQYGEDRYFFFNITNISREQTVNNNNYILGTLKCKTLINLMRKKRATMMVMKKDGDNLMKCLYTCPKERIKKSHFGIRYTVLFHTVGIFLDEFYAHSN